MQKIILLALALFLTGCKSNDVVIPDTPTQISHPAWPLPVLPYAFDWKVLVVEENVYVALEYDQSVEFRVFLEDVKRYIKESNGTICFYRAELKEPRCYSGVDKPTN